MPENISSFGVQIDDLIAFISIIAIPTLIVAELVLLGIVLFARTRRGGRAPYLAGVGWKQLKWVFVPVFGVVLLDALIDIKTGSAWAAVMRNLPGEGLNVKVTARQYRWVFTYPGEDGLLGTRDDVERPDEFIVPKGTNVIFDLEAKDMLHSLWVPALRFKQDAVPGRVIRRWFRADKEGSYTIACAELCGVGHSLMAGVLRVESPEAFARVMREESSRAVAAAAEAEAAKQRTAAMLAAAGESQRASLERGAALLKSKGCIACHSMDGSKLVGPSYQGIAGRQVRLADGRTFAADDAYLARSIREPSADQVEGYPQGVMPKLNLTDAEIADVIGYLKTLQ